MADEMETSGQRMIDFKCPYCGDAVSFPEMDADSAQDCPFCGEALIVPGESCEVGPKFPLPINTQRLVLRRLQLGDVDAFVKMSGDEESLRYHSWPVMDEEDVGQWVERDAKVHLSQLDPALWLAVELKENGNCIGLASIRYAPGTFQPEITVVIERSEQRKGYGSEAVRGLLDFGFNGLNMRRITAYCDDRNEAFTKLAAKIGLRQEGLFYGDRYVKEEWVNTVYYALLKEEYAKLI
jgi:RimJ/RimL family protein N-acetyltransferase